MDQSTARPALRRGRAYADQVEHTKARARLARRIGPNEEGIDLAVMPDEFVPRRPPDAAAASDPIYSSSKAPVYSW